MDEKIKIEKGKWAISKNRKKKHKRQKPTTTARICRGSLRASVGAVRPAAPTRMFLRITQWLHFKIPT